MQLVCSPRVAGVGFPVQEAAEAGLTLAEGASGLKNQTWEGNRCTNSPLDRETNFVYKYM